MGDDARFQNEMLTHGTIYSKTYLRNEIRKNRDKMTDADFMNLIPRSDSIRNAEMAELQERILQHPNLSQRYIDYETGCFRARQAESLSTALNARGKIPNEFLAYLHKEFWDKHEKHTHFTATIGGFCTIMSASWSRINITSDWTMGV